MKTGCGRLPGQSCQKHDRALDWWMIRHLTYICLSNEIIAINKKGLYFI